MQALFSWSATRPKSALALALCFVAGLSAGLPSLGVNASMEHLLSPSDPRVEHLEEVRDNFGDRPVVVASASLEDAFSPEAFAALRAYGEALASVEGVEEVWSLFTMPLPRSQGPVAPLRAVPESVEELLDFKAQVLGSSLLSGNFVSEDGNSLLYLVAIERAVGAGRNHEEILSRLEAVRSGHRDRLGPGAELDFLGVPVLKAAAEASIRWDLTRLAPAALLVVGTVIFLFYRSAAAMLLPLVTGSLSVVATLGFMGLFGYEITIFLSTVVVLLLVLGCTEDLHILSGYFDELEAGCEPGEALARTGATNGVALLLTSATTVLSFVTIAFTDILGLRQFAVICAFGMAANFVVTVLVAPALLALLPLPRRQGRGRRGGRGLGRVAGALREMALRRRGVAGGALLAAALLFGAGASRLEVNTDFLRIFSEDSETWRSYQRFREDFGGTAFLTVTFETHRRNGVDRPENLEQLRRLHEFLRREGGQVFGYIELLDAFGDDGASGGTAAAPLGGGGSFVLPRDSAPSSFSAPFRDFDGSRSATRLRVEAPTSRDLLAVESRILAFAEEFLGDEVELRVTGEPLVIAHLCDEVAWKLLGSLVVLSLVVALLIGAFLRSARLACLALLPNLFPLVATFGAMGWLGIPLGTGTFPVAIVAFGIAVDDTIHFLVRFSSRWREGAAAPLAVAETLAVELRPILATSVTVASGYLVLLLSPLRLSNEYGLLFSFACLSALVADLVLTPMLLSRLPRRGAVG